MSGGTGRAGLTIVGQGVGYYFGGPLGSFVGPAIGSSVGAALDVENSLDDEGASQEVSE